MQRSEHKRKGTLSGKGMEGTGKDEYESAGQRGCERNVLGRGKSIGEGLEARESSAPPRPWRKGKVAGGWHARGREVGGGKDGKSHVRQGFGPHVANGGRRKLIINQEVTSPMPSLTRRKSSHL